MDVPCYSALNQPPTRRPYLEIVASDTASVLVTNYNDNVMYYATSLLPATPSLSLRAEPGLLSIATEDGTPVRLDHGVLTLKATHQFPIYRRDPLTSATIEIRLPDGMELGGTITVAGFTRIRP